MNNKKSPTEILADFLTIINKAESSAGSQGMMSRFRDTMFDFWEDSERATTEFRNTMYTLREQLSAADEKIPNDPRWITARSAHDYMKGIVDAYSDRYEMEDIQASVAKLLHNTSEYESLRKVMEILSGLETTMNHIDLADAMDISCRSLSDKIKYLSDEGFIWKENSQGHYTASYGLTPRGIRSLKHFCIGGK